MYRFFIAALLLAVSNFAVADDIDNLGALTQAGFHDLSAGLAAATQFKQLSSAEPQGLFGFSVGVDVSGTQVANEHAWSRATGSDLSTLPMARVRVRKGLPGNIDVGGYYATAPDSNIKAYGAEIRYAILEGSAVMPAVGVRGTYNKLAGVDQLDFHTASLGISVSKGFGPITPYIGASHIWVSSTPDSNTLLGDESFGQNAVFVGLGASLAIVHVAFEANRMDDNTTYAVKLAVGL